MKAKTKATPGKPAPKHQRLKMALVPVLLLVLAYVVFAPADESVSDVELADDVPARLPIVAIPSNSQPAASSITQANKSATTHTWPEPTLEFLSSSNPFKSPEVKAAEPTGQHFVSATVQPVVDEVDEIDEVDQLANVASDLERRPVNFVFRSSKQNVIMLGDQVLEKGSQLSPAVQLHDIGDQALLLKLRP